MQGGVCDQNRKGNEHFAWKLFVARQGCMGFFMSREAAVGEILPENPDGPEQGRNRPDHIHDPHMLRVSNLIEHDYSCADGTKKQVSDG
jgi:hypothetical protein